MPDILMTHKGVRVYFTYRDNDIEQPASDYLFTTSATDGNEGRFDVRSLDVPCKEQLDMHPPYLTAHGNPAYATATDAQRAEWKQQWHEWLNYGGGQEQAIHAVIREAIDLGLIVASPDGANEDPTALPNSGPSGATTLCQRIIELDEQGQCPSDVDMHDLLAQLATHVKLIDNLATAVRALKSESWLEPTLTATEGLESAKRSTLKAITALTGIA